MVKLRQAIDCSRCHRRLLNGAKGLCQPCYDVTSRKKDAIVSPNKQRAKSIPMPMPRVVK